MKKKSNESKRNAENEENNKSTESAVSLRLSNKEDAGVILDQVAAEDKQIAESVKQEKRAQQQRVVLPKMLCSVAYFVGCMMVSAGYRSIFAGQMYSDAVFYGYICLIGLTISGLFVIWGSKWVESLLLELVEFVDNTASKEQAFAFSVIVMDEFRERVLSSIASNIDRSLFSVEFRPYIVDELLFVECAFCHLSSNCYATLIPRGILWSDYLAADEAGKQSRVAQQLSECMAKFSIFTPSASGSRA